MNAPAVVTVACLVLPDGSTAFIAFEPDGGMHARMAQIIDAWKAGQPIEQRQQHVQAGTTGGVIILRMLLEDFERATK